MLLTKSKGDRKASKGDRKTSKGDRKTSKGDRKSRPYKCLNASHIRRGDLHGRPYVAVLKSLS